ncbi:oxidoreductase [Fragilaria crotonensis]|nr:oxidoreductase [Fragilaria crotonensis]
MQLVVASFLLAAGLLASLVTAQLPSPVQTYFVPLPENDLIALFKEMSAGVNPPASGNVNTVISIAIASDNTIVYYDHWEDGFETDARLKTQSTTLIWGDGNLLNGIAPGTVDDKLKGGTAIVLSNNVPVPRVSSKIFFDGSDRIQSSLPIAVTRFAYPDQPGSLMAGAVEVFNFNSWGRKFIAPVGATTSSSTNAWEIARFYVMAGEDNSEVFKNGIKVGGTFNKGQSINFSVKQGDVITSDRPIQVDLIGADKDDTYELRWYAQVDAGDWTDEYISPVAETLGNTAFWFYNPNTSPITIGYNGGNLLSGSFVVPALSSKMIPCTTRSGTDRIQILTGDTTTTGSSTSRFSGVRFKGTGGSFYALVQVDADDEGQIYDWGFPMIPTSRLTSQALVGLGLGCTTGCLTDNNQGVKKERSVVWVTPIADTYIYVDFDGDGVFDFNQRVTALNSLRITDTKKNDNDMTGAIIASVDAAPVNGQPPVGLPVSIGLAWGQDPIRSYGGDGEALDLGTAVLPLANPDLNKEVVAVINPDGSVDPFKSVDQVGDIISYIIIVSNVGFADLTGVVVNDPLLTGKLVGPTESKNTDGILARGETFTYRGNYTVTAADISTKGGGDNNIENLASVTTKEYPKPVIVQVETPIFLATISGNVKEDVDANDTGDVNIPGVLITLLDGTNKVLATTLTDANGKYAFINLTAGNYAVKETNLSGYIDVKDVDGGDPNLIVVANVIGGTDRLGNDFVDERKGSISGFVFENVLNGPPIASVTITLRDSSNAIVATTSTDTAGFYKFSGLIPGLYTVVQTNLSNNVEDVSDFDSAPDGDPQDGDVVVDNKVFVKLNSNEDDVRNDFVDKLKNGSISGVVTDDKGNKLAGAVIKLIFGGVVVDTQTTGPAGTYSFTNRVPGDYIVQETNPSGYPLDVSDYDNSADGDAADSDTTVNNSIGVKLLPGENDTDNNFQDSNNGKISGTVKDDGGNPLVSVLITLKRLDGTTVATTLTGTDGSYLFSELEPDSYNVFEENPPLFPINVSDRDTDPDSVPDPTDSDIAVDNKIGVVLQPGETDKGNDFVDSNKGKITGSVTDNLSNPLVGVLLELKSGTTVIKTTLSGGNGGYVFDGIPPGTVKDDNGGPLSGVTVQLKDSTGAVVRTTATNGSGAYLFSNVFPGTYTLFEINPPGYNTDVSDYDTSNDGDAPDSVTTVDSTIGVVLLPGENDDNNDFVDSDNGSISGTVTEDQGMLVGVKLTLTTSNGVPVATTATNSNGAYIFSNVEPGAYFVVETNPDAYPSNVKDEDSTLDGDSGDTNKDVDNSIPVTLQKSESDTGNDFVDSNNGAISGTVKDDDGQALKNVIIQLKDTISGSIIQTAATNVLGAYSFNELEPGDYTVIEIQPGSHPISISDRDEVGDGDAGDSDTTVDNLIQVTLKPSESDASNNFVDSNKGSISGKVTSADGDLLSNVLITLLNGSSNIVATTVTDSNGKYLFAKIPPGDYKVIETNPADFPSNVSDKDESNDGDAGDNNDAIDNAIAVTIQPGEADKDNNFVDDDNGAISGSVTDDQGKPLANVKIELLKGGPDGSVIDTVFTNAVGSYTFNSVEPGDYVVKETNPVDYPKNLSDGDRSSDGDADDLSTTPDNLIKVTLKPGELDSDNNFVDSNNGSISGTVKDDEGKPLAGVTIQLQNPNGTIVATTTSGSSGAYTFPDVEPGPYVLVEKNPDGYPGDVSDYDTTPDGDAGDGVVNADNKIPVTLQPAEDDTGNDFVDSNNGLISGTVKDDQGNVLPGVKVELLKPDGSAVKATVTDSNGFYVFSEVEPGTYNIKETNPSAYPLNVSDFDASDDGDASDPDRKVDNLIGVTLKPGEKDTGNNFVDSNNGAITGTVKDDNGKPIAGVPIQLQSGGPMPTVIATTTTDFNGVYEFTEVEPGSYKVVETNLAAYPINVYDYDTTNDGDSEDGNKVTDNVVGVTLTPGETDTGNDFVDSNNGKITGTVKNDNGSPLSSVLLTLKDSTGVVATTVTNGNGIYVFDNLEPGIYTVVETNPVEYPANLLDQDFTNDSDPTDSDTTVDNIIGVTLQPGETDDGNNFVDSDNASISGSVKDDSQTPLVGVKISLSNSTGVVATTLTDAGGLYEFTGLEPGPYTVTETNPDGYKTDISDGDTSFDGDATDGVLTPPDNAISVTLMPSEADANNDFVDSNKGSISGRVVDDKLNPLAAVILSLNQGTTTVATTVTAADGSYKFTGVAPGDYSVIEINPDGYPSNVRDGDTDPDGDIGDADTTPDNSILVTVEPSEDDVGNDFVDSNNGSISGSVKDDNGNPIPGVTVALVDNNGITVDTATTNAGGGYVFNEVEPGQYTVVETQPAGYPNSVSDYDEDPDGDAEDVDKTVDNKINVTLKAGEADKENNFVDSDNGSISGSVFDDNGNSLPGVVITLLDGNLDVVQTTTTDGIGAYKFSEVEPGSYTVVEVNPPGFPSDLSDYDNTPDGDVGDSNTDVDNTIPVTLKPGENDDGNNFVDGNNAAISGTVKDDEGKPLSM